MNTQQDSIEDRLSRLETDMGEVKSDVAELKYDMAEVKSDVAELKALMGEFVVIQTQMLGMLEQLDRRTEDIALHMGVPKRNGTA